MSVTLCCASMNVTLYCDNNCYTVLCDDECYTVLHDASSVHCRPMNAIEFCVMISVTVWCVTVCV